MRDDVTAPPALSTRCLCRDDGSKTYEVWCEWCETLHQHDQIDGVLRPGCDRTGRSPYLKTGYRAKVVGQVSESAAGNFPPGLAIGAAAGVRRFRDAVRLSSPGFQKRLLRPFFSRAQRSRVFEETIQKTRFSVDETSWRAVDDANNSCEGRDLLGLVSKIFGVSAGVAVVRLVEGMTGVRFDDLGRIEIASAVDAACARTKPKPEASTQ